MLSAIPATLRAGDTWQWTTACADYSSADGWKLTTSFRGASSLDVEGDADAGGWESTAAAEDTAELTPGRYAWIERISKDGAVFTVGSGALEILPDLGATEAGHDARSDAEKQLAAAETALTSLLSKQHASVSFGDQSYTLQDIEKLMRVRDALKVRVEAEKAAANGSKRRTIKVYFPSC